MAPDRLVFTDELIEVGDTIGRKKAPDAVDAFECVS
jgi:hypothetical protein